MLMPASRNHSTRLCSSAGAPETLRLLKVSELSDLVCLASFNVVKLEEVARCASVGTPRS